MLKNNSYNSGLSVIGVHDLILHVPIKMVNLQYLFILMPPRRIYDAQELQPDFSGIPDILS